MMETPKRMTAETDEQRAARRALAQASAASGNFRMVITGTKINLVFAEPQGRK